MKAGLSAFLLYVICVVAVFSSVPSCPGAGNGSLLVDIDGINPSAETPYFEIRRLELEVSVYNVYEPFVWFWLPSIGPRFQMGYSVNQTVLDAQNRTVVVGETVTYPVEYLREKGAHSPKWEMVPIDDFTYATGFLLALPLNFTLDHPGMYVTLEGELQDEWVHHEDYLAFSSPPSNETLRTYGLNAGIFWNMQRAYNWKSFQLFTITFSRPATYVQRTSYTFTLPAVALLVLLFSSLVVLVKARLDLQASLTLYLGTAFFCLPFLLNYTRLGLGPITFIERVFYSDIILSAVLAGFSLVLRGLGKQDDESLEEYLRRIRNKHEDFEWVADC